MGCKLNQLPVIIRSRANGVTREVYYDEIPDVFRRFRFDPVQEFELPDAKESDEDFNDWLGLYRISTTTWFEHFLLEESQCN